MKNSIFLYPVCGVALTAFLQVTLYPAYPLYAFLVLSLFGLLIVHNFSASSVKFILFFLSPFLISFSSILIFYVFPDSRFIGSDLNWYGRVVNIVLLFSFFMLVTNLITKDDDVDGSAKKFQLYLRCYLLGGAVVLLSAIWHALDIHTGLVVFPFETRSLVHSSAGLLDQVSGRVTGIASEPSYLVPFLIDLIAVSLLLYGASLRSALFVSLSVFMIILSLSPSGYVSLISAFSLAGLLYSLKFKISKRVLFSLIILMGVIGGLFLWASRSGYADYVIYRIATFNPESSGRAFMYIYPIYWLMDSSLVNIMFGFGAKSYSILSYYYSAPSGHYINVTSNNYFVDMAWEAGVVGFILASIFFVFIFFKIFKSSLPRWHFFVVSFFAFHLLISSMFRADFASARYFFILSIIYLAIYKPDVFLSRRYIGGADEASR